MQPQHKQTTQPKGERNVQQGCEESESSAPNTEQPIEIQYVARNMQ